MFRNRIVNLNTIKIDAQGSIKAKRTIEIIFHIVHGFTMFPHSLMNLEGLSSFTRVRILSFGSLKQSTLTLLSSALVFHVLFREKGSSSFIPL